MRSFAIVFALLLAMIVPDAAAIEFFAVPQPNTAYVNGTTLIPLGSISDNTQVNSVTLASQTVSFSATMTKLSVPASWETWGSPPNTETATPNILYHETQAPLRLTLSTPSRTFGFELQGAEQIDSTYLVKFFDGAIEVGSIQKVVNGNAGALLFAANSPTNLFSSIEITNPSQNSGGWALANIRYSTTAVPEPSTYVFGIVATLAFAALARRRSSTPALVRN